MEEKRTFTIQALVVTVILNAILLAAIILVVGEAAQNQLWIILVTGLVITLLLWFAVQLLGNRLLEQVAQRTLAAAPKVAPAKAEPVTKPEPAAKPKAKPEPAAVAPKFDPAPLLEKGARTGAVQMLAILQRQGRLIDFLQEDLGAYADDQIGAAVRSIQEGTKQALNQHVKLEPVFSEEEGSRITIQPGFNPEQVRLTGNVVGEPPFKGELRHRGWRVASIDLPKRMGDSEQLPVVAAAEVEV